MKHPVIIAGAGPGGLTAALALQAHGIPVQLFEAVATLKPLGVGINLLPHAVRVLDTFGLSPKLDTIAIQTAELCYFNKFGQRIWAEPRGRAAGYAFPQYSIHRGRLQRLLYETAQERLGRDAVQTGYTLTSWQEISDGIVARFQRRDGVTEEVVGSCLIAADGIHSAARRQLYPDEGGPIYSGRILWRALSVAPPFLTGSTMIMAGHQNQKFVCYPIAPADEQSGKALINWVAELNVPDWTPPKQDWNRQVDKARFADPFQSWRFDWLDVPALIDSAEAIYEYPLVDRDPLPRWSHGRMTLLGDAAHPMYPIGSNGASQAILDAEAIANRLAATDDVVQALGQYDAERLPPTARIVLANRQNGPEQVMQLAEDRAPNGFADIEAVISRQELEEIAARYKQTAGFSVTQVNR
jgi:2-polyprenyl-6-methoxyphenol hydroxylase-like FAD-dependent oxidoreductase